MKVYDKPATSASELSGSACRDNSIDGNSSADTEESILEVEESNVMDIDSSEEVFAEILLECRENYYCSTEAIIDSCQKQPGF